MARMLAFDLVPGLEIVDVGTIGGERDDYDSWVVECMGNYVQLILTDGSMTPVYDGTDVVEIVENDAAIAFFREWVEQTGNVYE